MDNAPLHIRSFNDKIRILNQSHGKNIVLTAQEARGLHNDIYDLMATIAAMAKDNTSNAEVISVGMDGGSFK